MRLELSRRSDLALRALRHLSATRQRVKRPELAEAVGSTPDFLARVMGPLVAAGWVISEPGRSGGYQISASAYRASVLDLIERTEGAPDDGTCVLRGGPCEATARCALHDPWIRARAALMSELARTPVIELRERGRE